MTRILLFAIVLALVAGAAAFAAGATSERYRIHVGGNVIDVRGNYDDVGSVIEAAGIDLRPEDAVYPGIAASVEPGSSILVEQARPVGLSLDGTSRRLWTRQTDLASFLHEAGVEVGRADEVIADKQRVTFDELWRMSLPSEVEIRRFRRVSIYDGTRIITLRTSGDTVGQALQEAGLEVYESDRVQPPLGSWLESDLTIRIRRAMPLTLHVDGLILHKRSSNQVVGDILAEYGIALVGQDYARPELTALVGPGAVIEVVRVTEAFLVEDEPIPFETSWQPTAELELDQKAQLQQGQPGVLRRRIRIRYENGVEVNRTPDGEWIAREPLRGIMGYGTSITTRVLETAEGAYEYWRVLRMRVTSYTASSSGKPPDHPAYGVTASGLRAGTGIVAVDRSIVPFRSWVYVPGYGVGFAGDTGGGIIGRWIDLGYDEEEFVYWRGYVDVYFLTPVPPAERINYLVPDRLP